MKIFGKDFLRHQTIEISAKGEFENGTMLIYKATSKLLCKVNTNLFVTEVLRDKD